MELNLPLDPLSGATVMANWPYDMILMASPFTGYCPLCVRSARAGVSSLLCGETYGYYPKATPRHDAPREWCVGCGAALQTPIR